MTTIKQSAIRACLLLAIGLGGGVAFAQSAVPSPSAWYVGGSIGASSNKTDHGRVERGVLAGGIATGGGMNVTSISDDNHATGYKLYGGYRLNHWASVEASWFDLGRFGFQAQTSQGGSLTGKLRVKGIAIDLLGRWPITDSLSVFGRAGLALSRAEASFSQTGSLVVLRPDWNKTSLGPKLGLGVQYELERSLSLRLENEIYRINDAAGAHEHINLLSLSLIWRFDGN